MKNFSGTVGEPNSRQLLRSQFSKLGAVGRHSFLLPSPEMVVAMAHAAVGFAQWFGGSTTQGV